MHTSLLRFILGRGAASAVRSPGAAVCLLFALLLVPAGCGKGTGSLLITEPPSDLSYALASATYVTCVAVEPNPPTVTGAVVSYQVSPALPAGLQLDPTSGVITGTPLAPLAPTEFTVTAVGWVGSTSATIELEVAAAPAPADLSYEDPAPVYTAGILAQPNTPTFSGVVSNFRSEPPLPAGLAIDPQSGVIGGLPQEELAPTVVTILAENCLGEVASTQLTLEVLPSPGPQTTARYLVVAEGGGTLSTLRIDGTSGLARHAGFTTVPSIPRALAVPSYQGRVYALVGGVDVDAIYGFRIDAASGRLIALPGSPYGLPAGSGGRALAFDPSGERLYAALGATDRLAGFQVGLNGALTPLPGSPWALAAPGSPAEGPSALTFSPDGTRLLVTLESAFQVVSLPVGANGVPGVSGAPRASVGPGPRDITTVTDSAGNVFVLTANTWSDSVSSLRLQSGGGLAPVQNLALGAGTAPVTIRAGAFDNVRIAHVGLAGLGSINRVLVQQNTGQLSPPFSADLLGAVPRGLKFSLDGRFAFALFAEGQEIALADVDGQNGTLSPLTPSGLNVARPRTREGPQAIALVHAHSGAGLVTRALHAGNADAGDLSQFAYDADASLLAALDPPAVAGPSQPSAVLAHPVFPHLVAADLTGELGPDLFVYPVGPSGALGEPETYEIGDVALGGAGLVALAQDPGGRFLVAIRQDAASEALVFRVVAPPPGGGLASLEFLEAATLGPSARGAAIDPTGRFLYVTLAQTNQVAQFRLQPDTGALTPLDPPTVATGSSPSAIRIDPSGRFAFVANRGSDDLSAFRIAAGDGRLVALDPPTVDAGTNPSSLVFESLGRVLYVGNEGGGGTLSRYLMFVQAPNDGQTFAFDPTALGDGGAPAVPRALAVDGSGTRLFAALSGPGEVEWFELDLGQTGLPTSLGRTASGPGTGSLATFDRIADE